VYRCPPIRGNSILAGQAQARATRHQQLQPWAGSQQIHQLRCRLEQLLEVVQHQQERFLPECLGEGGERCLGAHDAQLQRVGNGREHQGRLTQGCQGDVAHTVGEVGTQA